MNDDFLIKYHPWNLLLESSFPTDLQLAVMKGVLDGKFHDEIAKDLSLKTTEIQKILNAGMDNAGVKDLYEMVVWGLRSGIIKDEDRSIISKMKIPQSPKASEAYPTWLNILNLIAGGYTPLDIEKEGVFSRETVKRMIQKTAEKFHLGPSMAKYIRFAISAVKPITPPSSTKPLPGPFKASKGPYQTIDFPPMKIGRYRPSNVDLSLNPRFQPRKGYKPTGSMKIAYAMLGLDVDEICKYMLGGASQFATDNLKVRQIMGRFWAKPDEVLWKLLEIAKSKFEYEIHHHHPDRNKSPESTIRAKQLNTAWKYIKDMFARRGFVLGGGEGTEKRYLVPPDLRRSHGR